MSPGLVLFAATCIWSSTFVVTKAVLVDAPPLTYLALRYGIAAAICLLLIAWRGLPALRVDRRGFLRDSALLGLLNAAGLALQVLGQVYTSPAKSAFITSLNTPLTALVALVLYREVPSAAQRGAVVLATSGLCLLTWPPAGAQLNPGDLLTVGCALIYAGFIVESARRLPRHDAFSLTMSQVILGALTFIVLVGATRLAMAFMEPARWPELLRLEARPFPHGPKIVAQLGYLSIVCVVIVMLMQTWAMRRLSATTSAVIFAVEPVLTTLIAVAVGGAAEWPGPRGVAGGIFVLCGVYVAEVRDLRRKKANASSMSASGALLRGVLPGPAVEQPEEAGEQ